MNELKNTKIGVIGLGYVGLPLACMFATRYRVTGYDCDPARVAELKRGYDFTDGVDKERLLTVQRDGMLCSDRASDIEGCDVYIVAVPTPVDRAHKPDVHQLKSASRLAGRMLRPGVTVVYESTVYPGMTEELCVPILEEASGLKCNRDFFVGYSPERINPGDHEHTVEKICKITSGSTPETADFVDRLYGSVLENGTCPVSSIRVAEAAKIVENTQRDVNIAFMNELAKIFEAMDMDLGEVLDAASTKWNFVRVKPGLVGGHCIGVDPYYLIQRAKQFGVSPRVVIEARRVNGGMGAYVAHQVIHRFNLKGLPVKDARILLLGFTFKENCPDIRNTRVADLYHVLAEYTSRITVCDPWVPAGKAKAEYGIEVTGTDPETLEAGSFDAVVVCTPHACFSDVDLQRLAKPGGIIYSLTRRN